MLFSKLGKVKETLKISHPSITKSTSSIPYLVFPLLQQKFPIPSIAAIFKKPHPLFMKRGVQTMEDPHPLSLHGDLLYSSSVRQISIHFFQKVLTLSQENLSSSIWSIKKGIYMSDQSCENSSVLIHRLKYLHLNNKSQVCKMFYFCL